MEHRRLKCPRPTPFKNAWRIKITARRRSVFFEKLIVIARFEFERVARVELFDCLSTTTGSLTPQLLLP